MHQLEDKVKELEERIKRLEQAQKCACGPSHVVFGPAVIQPPKIVPPTIC